MDEPARLKIFQAQTANVREVESAYRRHLRAINYALRCRRDAEVRQLTILQLLIYSSWSEALFLKVVHTPYGLDLHEIAQVQSARRSNGMGAAWRKVLELGLQKAEHGGQSSFKPNAAQQLERWVEAYVVEPSLIRNKVAHGQWKVCLNRENTAVNAELSLKLDTLDFVVVDRWYRVHRELAQTMEDLVESPNRAFRRDYWNRNTEIQRILDQTRDWTAASRQQVLLRKATRPDPS